jgi:hypothetical protein
MTASPMRIAALALLALLPVMAAATEEPRYSIVARHEGFEVREYPPYLVAEVTVPGPAGAAGNQGFRLLAAYIFGGNKGERKIEMTAPVTQAAAPTRIEMTAPVSQQVVPGGYVIQFVMPARFTLATLPEPMDPAVRLREMPGGRYAVIRYSGTWSDANYREHLEALQRGAAAAGLSTVGEPVYARYDAPYVPWFMRRNEIWLKLA